MTGDGLNDIILVHNGRIDYWPNLGYGQFGKRITMGNAPRLDADFDPTRLFLADLNGTGCADLVYVDFNRVHFWFNQSGNTWSNRLTISGTPLVNRMGSVQFADVFGTGTATLLWSYDYAGQSESNYKALDFCGGVVGHVGGRQWKGARAGNAERVKIEATVRLARAGMRAGRVREPVEVGRVRELVARVG